MTNRRTYQGRPLPRPDEELVDQGLGFDVGTLLSRRQSLRFLGLGAAAYRAKPPLPSHAVVDQS